MTFTKEKLTQIIDSADEVITALAGTNEDIHQEDSKKMCDAWDYLNDVAAPPEVVKRLAEIALAALTAEPVGYIDAEYAELLRAGHIESCSVYAERGEGCEPAYAALPAPVVPEEVASAIEKLKQTLVNCNRYNYCFDAVKRVEEACRAAMLQGKAINHPSSIASGAGAGCSGEIKQLSSNEPVSQRDELPYDPQIAAYEKIMEQAIPDGYALVPMKLAAENGAKGALLGEFSETKFINCPECFGDDECETCDGSGRLEITVPVSWTTIKAIWAKGVEHFSAAPQQEV